MDEKSIFCQHLKPQHCYNLQFLTCVKSQSIIWLHELCGYSAVILSWIPEHFSSKCNFYFLQRRPQQHCTKSPPSPPLTAKKLLTGRWPHPLPGWKEWVVKSASSSKKFNHSNLHSLLSTCFSSNCYNDTVFVALQSPGCKTQEKQQTEMFKCTAAVEFFFQSGFFFLAPHLHSLLNLPLDFKPTFLMGRACAFLVKGWFSG